MADYQSYLPVVFTIDGGPDYFGVPITISTESTVYFRGELIKITDIENYVAHMESELMASYLTSNEAHETEVSNLKRAYEHRINEMYDIISMFEAALKAAAR